MTTTSTPTLSDEEYARRLQEELLRQEREAAAAVKQDKKKEIPVRNNDSHDDLEMARKMQELEVLGLGNINSIHRQSQVAEDMKKAAAELQQQQDDDINNDMLDGPSFHYPIVEQDLLSEEEEEGEQEKEHHKKKPAANMESQTEQDARLARLVAQSGKSLRHIPQQEDRKYSAVTRNSPPSYPVDCTPTTEEADARLARLLAQSGKSFRDLSSEELQKEPRQGRRQAPLRQPSYEDDARLAMLLAQSGKSLRELQLLDQDESTTRKDPSSSRQKQYYEEDARLAMLVAQSGKSLRDLNNPTTTTPTTSQGSITMPSSRATSSPRNRAVPQESPRSTHHHKHTPSPHNSPATSQQSIPPPERAEPQGHPYAPAPSRESPRYSPKANHLENHVVASDNADFPRYNVSPPRESPRYSPGSSQQQSMPQRERTPARQNIPPLRESPRYSPGSSQQSIPQREMTPTGHNIAPVGDFSRYSSGSSQQSIPQRERTNARQNMPPLGEPPRYSPAGTTTDFPRYNVSPPRESPRYSPPQEVLSGRNNDPSPYRPPRAVESPRHHIPSRQESPRYSPHASQQGLPPRESPPRHLPNESLVTPNLEDRPSFSEQLSVRRHSASMTHSLAHSDGDVLASNPQLIQQKVPRVSRSYSSGGFPATTNLQAATSRHASDPPRSHKPSSLQDSSEFSTIRNEDAILDIPSKVAKDKKASTKKAVPLVKKRFFGFGRSKREKQDIVDDKPPATVDPQNHLANLQEENKFPLPKPVSRPSDTISAPPGPVPYSVSVSTEPRQVPSATASTKRGQPAIRFGAKCASCGETLKNPVFALDKKFHPECFRCIKCSELVDSNGTFSFIENAAGKQPMHTHCYAELFGIRCAVCEKEIPPGSNGKVSFVKHPFFENELMCPHHARSMTRRCTGCHRFEPLHDPFIDLSDAGRCLCLSCCRTVVVDSQEAQQLWQTVVQFFDKKLNLPIWKDFREVPILVVGTDALGDQMRKANNIHAGATQIMTRGLCLSEHACGKRFKMDRFKFDKQNLSFRAVDAEERGFTYFQVPDVDKVNPNSCVTAILCLSGLPKDLAASVLAHEATHAWLKLHPRFDFRKPIPPLVEEGCAQLIASLFLAGGLEEPPPLPNNDGKGPSDEKLREYFKFNIEYDDHEVYGQGFKLAAKAYSKIGIEALMSHIVLYQDFPTV